MIRAAWKSRIAEITVEMEAKIEAAAREGAEDIAAGAKSRVPVDSGDLRDAIHVDTEPEGSYVIAGDSDVFYGHIVENGSVKQPARPFLTPAAEAAREGIESNMRRVLRGL